MNGIGFLTIQDQGNPCARDINSLFSVELQTEELPDIIAYLNKGVPVINCISSLYDESGELIGPNVICTDGLWIWPGYYIYYLKKYPQIVVPKAFIEYVRSKGQNEINLDLNERKYVEYVVARMLGMRISDNTIRLSGISEIIEQRGSRVNCF